MVRIGEGHHQEVGLIAVFLGSKPSGGAVGDPIGRIELFRKSRSHGLGAGIVMGHLIFRSHQAFCLGFSPQ